MITFVTGNQRKADYFARLLGMPVAHRKLNLDELQSPDIRAVVEHKARQAYDIVQKPVVVDDASLEFCALGKLPGTFIKFFVEEGLEKSCRILDGFDDRSAVGKAGIGYCDRKGFHYFEGEIRGEIAAAPRGTNGFGWDAIFIPEGYGGRTRAELDDEEYDALYRVIRPIDGLKEFLKSKK